MLAKTIFAATFFALAQFAVATPPGCLLGAVNTYDEPSNVKAVCKEKNLSGTVQKFCGDATESAMAALADICNDSGVKVATDIPSASASSSKPSGTGSSAAHHTGSASYGSGNSTGSVPTATGSPQASATGTTGGANASGTSSGGLPESTGAAGRMEVGIAAMMAGLVAIAL